MPEILRGYAAGGGIKYNMALMAPKPSRADAFNKILNINQMLREDDASDGLAIRLPSSAHIQEQSSMSGDVGRSRLPLDYATNLPPISWPLSTAPRCSRLLLHQTSISKI